MIAAAAAAVVLISGQASAQAGIIRTVVGGVGDGGPATEALVAASGMAVDAAGNLYTAGSDNRVRKIDGATGIITTVAGTGAPGSSGDGGPATQAKLNSPSSLAFDIAGNLYVVSWDRLRRIGTNGIITTVAGEGGPAALASIRPRVVVVDRLGNVFVAVRESETQFSEWLVKRIDPTGGITTYAGGGDCGYYGVTPGGVGVDYGNVGYREVCAGRPEDMRFRSIGDLALDSEGNLYVSDPISRVVFKISALGFASRYVGRGYDLSGGNGGPSMLADVRAPSGLTVDSADNLYIADWLTHNVRKVDSRGIITSFAGTGSDEYSGDGGSAQSAGMQPYDIAANPSGGAEDLYLSDHGQVVRRIRQGTITRVAGLVRRCHVLRLPHVYVGYPIHPTALCKPEDVAFDAAGRMYVADTENGLVRRYDPATGTIVTVAGGGASGSTSSNPREVSLTPKALAFDTAGNLYVASGAVWKLDLQANRITVVAGDPNRQQYGGDGGPAVGAWLNHPEAMVMAPDGTLYVADTRNCRIRRVSPAGIITTIAGTGVCEEGPIQDGILATSAAMSLPAGLALGGGTLYVADQTGAYNRIRAIDLATNRIRLFAGTGSCLDPTLGDGGPATQACVGSYKMIFGPDGALYITNGTIRRIAGGIITTVAGTSEVYDGPLYGTDDVPAKQSYLGAPRGIAFRNGDLYVTDTESSRIRVVEGPIS